MPKEEKKSHEEEEGDEQIDPEPGVDKEREEEKAAEKPKRLVDDANLAAKRLEDANKVHSANLDRQEALQVEQTLGGKTEAASPKKEESPEDYAKKVMANEADTN